MLPLTVAVQPGVPMQSGRVSSESWTVAAEPAAPVPTEPSTVSAAVSGRCTNVAGAPGSPGVTVTSTWFSLSITGVISRLPFGTRYGWNRRSSTTTSPLTEVIPAALTCRARSSTANSGSCGVRIAVPRPLASLWSKPVYCTVFASIRRPPKARSPPPTSTRLPVRTPLSSTVPCRYTGVDCRASAPN